MKVDVSSLWAVAKPTVHAGAGGYDCGKQGVIVFLFQCLTACSFLKDVKVDAKAKTAAARSGWATVRTRGFPGQFCGSANRGIFDLQKVAICTAGPADSRL